MQLRNPDIYVYKLDNDGTFEAIGEINKYTSLMWPDKFVGYSMFELNAPVNEENKNLLKKGNILWCGGDNACVIEIIQSDKDENGQKTFKIKGRTLEMILTTRIIWGTYHCVNKYSSTVMYEIVDKQCVNPSDVRRKIPFLECAKDELFGEVISFQRTGGEVYDTLENLAIEAELGFDVLFRPREKKLIFKVTKGIDKSIPPSSGEVSNLVIFSTDLEDILSSSYYTNNQDLKTLAYVSGEGTGTDRAHVISGNADHSGFERREAYVDARDLQSKITHEDGTTEDIPEEDYNEMLNDRGMIKLAEFIAIDSFEARIRTVGNIQYEYGVDYNKGDKVIVQDTDLGVQVVAIVTEVSQNYDDEYEFVVTFGYEYPTLIQKVKRKIS